MYRFLESPYVFNAFVGNSNESDLWQSVVESERHALTVFLPEIADAARLVQDVSINPAVITPNSDGVGDKSRIRFAVFKTSAQAKVGVYSLAGTLITASGWRDQLGRLPGLHLVPGRIDPKPLCRRAFTCVASSWMHRPEPRLSPA